MKVEIVEAVWLDEAEDISVEELAERSGLSQQELLELADYETFPRTPAHTAARTFKAQCIATARLACRLRDDFDLAPDALALVIALRERIDSLEEELRRLQARLPAAGNPGTKVEID